MLVVKPADFNDWQRRRSLRRDELWGDVPIVFSSRDGKGRPYQGDPELVRLLSKRRNPQLPVRRNAA